MIRSLRWRLTLAIVLVTMTASAVVGIAVDRYTQQRFEQFLDVETVLEEDGGPAIAAASLETLAARLRAGDTAGLDAELLRAAEQTGGARLILFGDDGALLADTEPSGSVTLREDGTLEVVRVVEGDGGAGDPGGTTRPSDRREERLAMSGGTPVADEQGRLGTLFVLPARDPDPPTNPAQGFRRSAGRAQLVGVLAATALALAIALVLSGTIVGPLERLTRATRKLQAGDLGQRVDARSRNEIGDLGRAFNAMAASIEQHEQARNNMVSDIAHELRTPLTHLRCRLETVQDGLAPMDAALVDGLHREIVHLARLVDDLQELALAEAGRLRLYPTAADLGALSREVIETLPGTPGTPPIAAEIAGELPPARVDVDRFRQVLRNLLENAVRHGSERGNVTVRVGPGEAPGTIRCAVEDDGPGIPPEHRDRIFERFHRTDPSRARATGGAGLGLAIARQLVEAWGGEIGVASPPGTGATFWFTAPMA